jgi:hypothetical protein
VTRERVWLGAAAALCAATAAALVGFSWVERNAVCFGVSCFRGGNSVGETEQLHKLPGNHCVVTTGLLLSSQYSHLNNAAISHHIVHLNYLIRPYDFIYVIPKQRDAPLIILDPMYSFGESYFDACRDDVNVSIKGDRFLINLKQAGG